jgi:hypothetical protein
MTRMRYHRVVCHDGYDVSIQAGPYSYSHPRDDHGPYDEVELGYPNRSDPLIDSYAEDPEALTNTVYPFVPAKIAHLLIAKHGGALSGTVPSGVIMLMAPDAIATTESGSKN